MRNEILGLVDSKSDYIGASASTLCMIHCMVTPLLFAVQAATLSCSELSPWWWKMVDYIFLFVTFFAIHFTNKNTTSVWIPKVLYGCWGVLSLLVINDTVHLVTIPHMIIYIPALGMTFLHLYNRKYCHCQLDRCCTSK